MKKTIVIEGVEYELTPVTEKERLIVEFQTKLEIHPNIIDRMTWYDAAEYIEKMGGGWRLPTIMEFHIIFKSDVKYKFKDNDIFWSSRNVPSDIQWMFHFSDSDMYLRNKLLTLYSLAVRLNPDMWLK
jgi:hypothetical protein